MNLLTIASHLECNRIHQFSLSPSCLELSLYGYTEYIILFISCILYPGLARWNAFATTPNTKMLHARQLLKT